MIQLGFHALISLILYIFCCGLSFSAFRHVKIEKIFPVKLTFEAQVILLFTSLAVGYGTAQLIIAIIDASTQLVYLF